MADKSEKPSKADKILEVMDDLSAAVDGFAARLQALERLFDGINCTLVSVSNQLDRMQEDGYQTRKIVDETQTTVQVMNDRLEDVAKISENLEKNFPDFQEVADDIRRRERQEQLFEARAAMGKIKFVSMRA
jgi:ABC-type transporter Mla subunit MlaD